MILFSYREYDWHGTCICKDYAKPSPTHVPIQSNIGLVFALARIMPNNPGIEFAIAIAGPVCGE